MKWLRRLRARWIRTARERELIREMPESSDMLPMFILVPSWFSDVEREAMCILIFEHAEPVAQAFIGNRTELQEEVMACHKVTQGCFRKGVE